MWSKKFWVQKCTFKWQNSTTEPQLTFEDLSDEDKCFPSGLREHHRRAIRNSLKARGNGRHQESKAS